MRNPLIKPSPAATNFSNYYRTVTQNGIVLSPYNLSPAIYATTTTGAAPSDAVTYGTSSSLFLSTGTSLTAAQTAIYICQPGIYSNYWREIFPANVLIGTKTTNLSLTKTGGANNINWGIGFTWTTGTQIMNNIVVNTATTNIDIDTNGYTAAQYIEIPKDGLYYFAAILPKGSSNTDSTSFELSFWKNGAVHQYGVNRYDTAATTVAKVQIIEMLDWFSASDIINLVVNFDGVLLYTFGSGSRYVVKCLTNGYF